MGIQIAPFAAFVIAATFTPGPNNIMAMNSARKKGVLGSWVFISGMTAGIFVITILCGFSNVALIRALPSAQTVLGAIGAFYMLYLAFKPFFPAKEHAPRDPGESHPFITGMLLQFLNFKLVLYAIALMSEFILPHYSTPPAIFAFSAGQALIGLSSLVCWAFFGAVFQRFFSEHEFAVNVVMAIALVYCAYSVSGLDVKTLFADSGYYDYIAAARP